VVEGAEKIVVDLGHGKSRRARVVAADRSIDIAVLRIPSAGLRLSPLPIGDSNRVHIGDEVVAIGSPFGLGQSLTTGIISAVGRHIQTPSGVVIQDALQTDAPINPGNSGGPLLDGRGRVIGVNSQIETAGAGDGSIGVAFAVPVDEAKRVLAEVR